MDPWNPTADARIYVDPNGIGYDPLKLRQDFILASNGDVWSVQNLRHAAATALNEGGPAPADQAEVELARAERRLIGWARQVFSLPEYDHGTLGERSGGVTDAEALILFDHFLRWLNQVKPGTRD